MRVTSQDISPFPYSLPLPWVWHLNLEGINLLSNTEEWNEILFALTTECGLNKQDVDNLEVRELLDYLKVCHKVLDTRMRKHKEVEAEIAKAKQARRR